MSLVDFINESKKYDSDKTVAINIVAAAIPHLKDFKIGKTGEEVEDRLDKPDYQDDYKFTHIKSIYHTSQKSLASKMEADLIDYFSDQEKCLNDKGGKESLHDTMKDSSDYYVYLVWK